MVRLPVYQTEHLLMLLQLLLLQMAQTSMLQLLPLRRLHRVLSHHCSKIEALQSPLFPPTHTILLLCKCDTLHHDSLF